MDTPRKRERPVMKRFLIEFILVNWRNDSPTEAAKGNQKKESKKDQPSEINS